MTFGQRVKNMREDYGFSQRELEKKSNLCREYISKFENEHLTNPTISMVRKIARAFNMSISEFLEGVN